MNNKFKNYFFIILAGVLLPTIALTQTTLTFTNAASTGQFGPNQTQVNAAYDGTTLDDAVTINTEGIQEWTVPATGVYTIEVWGAQGGNNGWYTGGKGARMKGDFTLSANDVLKFVVGQQGYTSDTYRAGGGGGSFVWIDDGALLIVAGGGGGGGGASNDSDEHGTTGTAGKAGQSTVTSSYPGGSGGTSGGGGGDGYGGNGANHAGGGAGWISDGEGSYPGRTKYYFYGGGNYQGGYGGGGGINNSGAGGGGGYSGGGGSGWAYGSPNSNAPGGGGGSYNENGSNQSNSSGAREGHGQVVITYCIGFCFESIAKAADNSYVDVTFTAGAYNTNGGSGALETSDFSLTFAQNGGPATAASISSIKKNDNTAAGSASALSGGETVIRMFLNITGLPAGVETILIGPTNGSSIYDSEGTAMNAASAIAATLNDVNGPYITGTTIPSTNATVAVTFSEAAYNTNGGSG
ncbi:uncharacterized protein METZ01_LOCUS234262, partial [marine metagenome]